MGTEKRERQKANRQQRLSELERSEKAAERRNRLGLFGIIALFVFGLLLLFRFAGGDDDSQIAAPELDPDAITTTTVGDDSAAPDTDAPVLVTVPEPGGTITGETPCPAEDGSSERVTSFESAPPICIDTDATYIAQVSTTKGDYTVELDASAAPNTVNNFVVLSRYHYYDGVAFHRIIPDFVVQGGDAVGPNPGTGNPGYQFDDELPEIDPDTERAYDAGSVAMANSGANTNGSQFFVVTGENGQNLPPLYSKFGQVTEGLDIVMDIEATGSAGGTPTEEVIINSITITEQ